MNIALLNTVREERRVESEEKQEDKSNCNECILNNLSIEACSLLLGVNVVGNDKVIIINVVSPIAPLNFLITVIILNILSLLFSRGIFINVFQSTAAFVHAASLSFFRAHNSLRLLIFVSTTYVSLASSSI
jgi:hypothetical protein